MHGLRQDILYAWRILKKSPAFVFTTVVSLALGIGINAALFSVMHTALNRPVSGRAPAELVDLSVQSPAGNGFFPVPEYRELCRRTRVFSGIIGLSPDRYRIAGQGKPEMVNAVSATTNFFTVFGQQPALGRAFSRDENAPGEAVLSHGFWKRRFGADPGAIGQPLVLFMGPRKFTYTIVGVMPPDFRFATAGSPDLIIPFREMTDDKRTLAVMARIKPGITLAQARAGTEILFGQLGELFPDTLGKGRLAFRPKLRRDAQTLTVAAVMQVVVGLVLLIACVNVMNLLLARHQQRHAEVATRLALGASRGRLIRQLLLESLALAVPSALGGYAVAVLTITLVEKARIPGLENTFMYFYLDRTVLGFALAAGIFATVIAGLWPARAASRTNLVLAIKGSGAAVGGRKFGLRGALVAVQLALSLVGISSTIMLTKGVWELNPFDRGVDAHKVLVATTWPMMSNYTEAGAGDFRRRLAGQLEREPGVTAVAFAASAPGQEFSQNVLHTGSPLLPKRETVTIRGNRVGPGYFRTLGIEILRGHEFTEPDLAGRAVCVVNETMARRFWPGQEPIGQMLRLDGPKGKDHEVVGVARDTAYEKEGNDYGPYVYLPWNAGKFLTLVLRTERPAGLYAEPVRRAVAALDPEMPLIRIGVLADQLTAERGLEMRLRACVFGSIGAVALLLSSLGLYGVIAYLVARRTREIGIRLALGAGRSDVLMTVIRDGMRLVSVGMAAGLALSFLVSPVLTHHLYNIKPNQPAVLAGACGILTLVAVAAMIIPARRACKVKALAALRYE